MPTNEPTALLDPSKMPKVTVPQVAGFLGIITLPVLVLLGVDLNVEQLHAVTTIRDAGVALIGGDALVRLGRSIGTGLQNKNSNSV